MDNYKTWGRLHCHNKSLIFRLWHLQILNNFKKCTLHKKTNFCRTLTFFHVTETSDWIWQGYKDRCVHAVRCSLSGYSVIIFSLLVLTGLVSSWLVSLFVTTRLHVSWLFLIGPHLPTLILSARWRDRTDRLRSASSCTGSHTERRVLDKFLMFPFIDKSISIAELSSSAKLSLKIRPVVYTRLLFTVHKTTCQNWGMSETSMTVLQRRL